MLSSVSVGVVVKRGLSAGFNITYIRINTHVLNTAVPYGVDKHIY